MTLPAFPGHLHLLHLLIAPLSAPSFRSQPFSSPFGGYYGPTRRICFISLARESTLTLLVMASIAAPACRTARNDIFRLRYEEERPNGTRNGFFPLDRLRKYLSSEKVDEILGCKCEACRQDRSAMGYPDNIQPLNSRPAIVGEGGDTKDTRRTAFGLFSLLIHVEHPSLVLGFLEHDLNDYWLEASPNSFKEANLRSYTRNFVINDQDGFRRFAFAFATFMPQFAVRHMDSGRFSRYPAGTILPFINEIEIGKQENEDGQLTNIGAHGKVFSFEIYGEYRKFRHASDVKRFARKAVEPSILTEHLERANLESVQTYNDTHIVKLIKAYSLGGVINLIFPLADTNLDDLLRNPDKGYANSRGGQLASCPAWEQLLGIAKALSKIAGNPTDVAPIGAPDGPSIECWYGFHFDLKPANILISDDGTWLITDFGQSAFTLTSDRTPRARSNGGTDAYAPPEVVNGERQFSRRYDVWSLGCIALEVTAFVVLGHDGLKGSSNVAGLDQVRHSHDGWSRLEDSRFFYRAAPKADPEVKPSIIEFMELLRESVRHLDPRSQQFLADILKLIELMLQPAVARRIDIGEVIRILDATITQASSRDDGGQPLQTVVAPGERDIGAPELGLIKLWHWSRAGGKWQSSALRVFEDLDGNLRFYSLAYNRYPSEKDLRRERDTILPHYAYWKHEKPQASEPWLGFSDPTTGVPHIPSLVYAFRSLDDVRFVQSKLTYQRIAMSFPLKSVAVKKYVKITRKAMNALTGVFHSKTSHTGKPDHILDRKDLGPATVQLWEEEVDPVAMERREMHSVSSSTTNGPRKPRIQLRQQPGYRDILPRRTVIYLHDHGCILIVKTEVNWIARVFDNVIYFQPTAPDRDPQFVASLIRPTNASIASLPLCPQVLRRIESQNRFEADEFILQFAIDDTAQQFNQKYRTMKQAWVAEKAEVEKLQGFTPIQLQPVPHSEPLSLVPRRKQGHPIPIQEQYAPTARPLNKGKGRASIPHIFHDENGYHNGYIAPEPQSRVDNTTFNVANGHLSPPPFHTTPRRPTSNRDVKPLRQARGGGRGAPPKSWSKQAYEKSGAALKDSVSPDRIRYG
ncbi:kinase-like protein [Melanomma pulvis-pyrius CBS 109.77]|uniref:Kinase-like protein n=1 Tax=Melanomma pulvis-pyrius CBS 109.77 TaxID=1314802 RepID=A0A6A6XIQ3_9PLEO|nr:kinase-like protein [Melanomma pulvis-pyrius CBS 109.77]